MTSLELILTSTTSLLAGGNVFQLVASRRKRRAESSAASDQVLFNRIEFLEKRIEKLEQNACFKDNCPDRQ